MPLRGSASPVASRSSWLSWRPMRSRSSGLYQRILTVFYEINFERYRTRHRRDPDVETLVFMIWIPATAFQNIDRGLEEAALYAGAPDLAPSCGSPCRWRRRPSRWPCCSPLSPPLMSRRARFCWAAGPYNHALIMYNAVNSYAQPEGAVFALMLSIPSILVLAGRAIAGAWPGSRDPGSGA